MQVGYARVSTPDQSLTVQLEALQQSGCTKLFQEVASGAQADRQGLTAAWIMCDRVTPWWCGASIGSADRWVSSLC